ncbi:1-phosphofructokinase [Streptomyces sp. 1114.5]|uniref:1-phosphofructokinase n=1 Tax=unclassified Streptomyces TaxID=2593676 RepID=UPI000BD2171E|nr:MULTISPECIES: 1-phosphofructokinase [unclassified Streptomyces]RKT19839.1 1-phosphofructokinase [Streptomyces sp. 1114.5]SOB86038.1 fructose-1-phosphate kinase [Streptomyces sp. 1331.2]
MIVTITPNPSLDRTYELGVLVPGEVNRAAHDRLDPGGKGVNVSRALTAAGHRTSALLPLGGLSGQLLADLLRRQGIEVGAVAIAGDTRINVSIAEDGGSLTKINAVGPELSAAESAALLALVRDAQKSGRGAGNDVDWLACCGSLPRGLAPEWYAEVVAQVHSGGARIALDTSGPALLAALSARPDVVKPNREELAEAVGRPVHTVGDAVAAAVELRERGAQQVLASLGADGMLLIAEEGSWYGSAPVAAVRSDVGAGDASLAGFLGAGGTGPGALAAALAHGAAAVQLPGSVMPTPADLDPAAVVVTADLPLERPLRG